MMTEAELQLLVQQMQTEQDPVAKRRMQIAINQQLTGANAPTPRADPRGNDFRVMQNYRQQAQDYDRLVANQPTDRELFEMATRARK